MRKITLLFMMTICFPFLTNAQQDIVPTDGDTETFSPDTGDFFYDPGGPGGTSTDGDPGNYPNCNCDTVTTLEDVTEIEFLDFEVFGDFDWLIIYDGVDISGDVLYDSNTNTSTDTFAGMTSLNGSAIFEGTSGSITFELHASGVINRLGWEVEILETIGSTDPCAPPENVIEENITETTAEFSWDASDDETNGYNWEVFEAGANPEDDDPIYEGDVTSGTTSVEITDLTPSSDYDFYVQTVCDDDQTSDWTDSEAFTTLTCNPPANVIVDEIFDDYVQFSWDASTDETNGYNWAIFEAGADPETNDPIADGNVASGMTSVEITDLTPDTEYDFYVQTICDNDVGIWTETLAFTTLEQCEPPTEVILELVTQNTVQFSWDASDDETNGYNWAVFEAGADPETDDPIADGNVPTEITFVEIDGLEPNTEYDFYLQTICDNDMTSEWTTPENFTTEELSVASQSLENLNYYPNPVQDILTIEAAQQVNQLQVYDLSGRLILDKKPNQQSFTIDTNTMQTGAYFIKVSIDDKHKVFKVIKK